MKRIDQWDVPDKITPEDVQAVKIEQLRRAHNELVEYLEKINLCGQSANPYEILRNPL